MEIPVMLGTYKHKAMLSLYASTWKAPWERERVKELKGPAIQIHFATNRGSRSLKQVINICKQMQRSVRSEILL